jgi:hypothetical protein
MPAVFGAEFFMFPEILLQPNGKRHERHHKAIKWFVPNGGSCEDASAKR